MKCAHIRRTITPGHSYDAESCIDCGKLLRYIDNGQIDGRDLYGHVASLRQMKKERETRDENLSKVCSR